MNKFHAKEILKIDHEKTGLSKKCCLNFKIPMIFLKTNETRVFRASNYLAGQLPGHGYWFIPSMF